MKCNRILRDEQAGFTLLETMMGLFVVALTSSLLVMPALRDLSYWRLIGARQALTDQLHYAQALATTTDQYAQVRISMYTPWYSTWSGTNLLSWTYFPSGVNYVDGYLQMVSGNLIYDVLGDSELAGTIRLQSSGIEADVRVFLGSGLISQSWGTTG